MKNKCYITTSILYTNAPVHIGFAMELIQADVLARYHRLVGDDTFFLTGTDEHGSTVVKGAAKANKEVKIFVDEMAARSQKLARVLNISNDDFIRTTDRERHWPAVIKFWKELAEAGDLYKKKYKGLYCVGHESFIKRSELVDGRCPLHKTIPEAIEEENWFFKFTKYKKKVGEKIKSGELKIVPESRVQEVINLIDDAEDISFSRPISSLKWGIPVPSDPEQTIYVWADALVNYISALGYGGNEERMDCWPADVHLVGKDILRFHAMIWPAMLLSVGLSLPKAIYVHGFITVDGEKMSKTVGNVVDPFEAVKKYGVEVVRYFLLREIPSGDDGDFSYKKLEERYNGDLANGLGNLIQRTLTLIDTKMDGELIHKERLINEEVKNQIDEKFKAYKTNIEKFSLHEAAADIWKLISFADKYMDDKKPWVVIKHDESEFLAIMTNLLYIIYNAAWMFLPFMPETADKIFESIGADKEATSIDDYAFKIKKSGVLFPRLNI